MMLRLHAALLVLVVTAATWNGAAASSQAQPAQPASVFAAASLKESLDEAAAAFEHETGQALRVTYAASSALARQIEDGAPADVFVSADLEWMDWLQQRDRLDLPSRASLVRNTLVLIASTSSGIEPFALETDRDLVGRLGADGRLALAFTQSVPAGKYGRAALESLGIWDSVAARVVETENVRAALLLVARDEAQVGIVYATDARAEPRVAVLASFPATSHPAIVYPIARLRASAHPGAATVVQWLQSKTARAIFDRHGFLPP